MFSHLLCTYTLLLSHQFNVAFNMRSMAAFFISKDRIKCQFNTTVRQRPRYVIVTSCCKSNKYNDVGTNNRCTIDFFYCSQVVGIDDSLGLYTDHHSWFTMTSERIMISRLRIFMLP